MHFFYIPYNDDLIFLEYIVVKDLKLNVSSYYIIEWLGDCMAVK